MQRAEGGTRGEGKQIEEDGENKNEELGEDEVKKRSRQRRESETDFRLVISRPKGVWVSDAEDV